MHTPLWYVMIRVWGATPEKEKAVDYLNNRHRMVQKAAKLIPTWLNVYEVTRNYGGPEEGGWYYNHMDCIESYDVSRLSYPKMLELLAELLKRWEEVAVGDIYSVRGGVAYEVCVEGAECKSQTTQR